MQIRPWCRFGDATAVLGPGDDGAGDALVTLGGIWPRRRVDPPGQRENASPGGCAGGEDEGWDTPRLESLVRMRPGAQISQGALNERVPAAARWSVQPAVRRSAACAMQATVVSVFPRVEPPADGGMA